MDKIHAVLVSPNGKRALPMRWLPKTFGWHHESHRWSGWEVCGETWEKQTIRLFMREGWKLVRVA